VRDFAARFAPGATLLYLGDTAKKTLVREEEILRKLCVPITKHDKLPDIILYDEARQWLLWSPRMARSRPSARSN
jgi:hypothetical protein